MTNISSKNFIFNIKNDQVVKNNLKMNNHPNF